MTKHPQSLKLVNCSVYMRAGAHLAARNAGRNSSMQLTRAADYALRAMIHLASLPAAERALLPQMARAIGAPESFLSKVLQSLCRAGLAASHRGQSGGFEILPAGRTATVAAVILSIEGPIALNVCIDPELSCSRKSFCPAHPVWVAAQRAMLAVLNAKTIAGLAAIPPAKRCGLSGQ